MSINTLKDYMNQKRIGRFRRPRYTLKVKDNGRSADFIIPSFTIGCELVCTYCYVARHRNIGNPLEEYTNLPAILDAIKKHHDSLGSKNTPNQCDPDYWTYDIGESTDCLTPANIETTNQIIQYFDRYLPNAKPTFATKVGNVNKLTDVNDRRARIRFSLMPERVRKITEPVTSSIYSRMMAIQKAFDLGYEVHVNFSPVILYDGWVNEYIDLMKELDSTLSDEVKNQLKAEVIFLTHHSKLHSKNLDVFPEAEKMLWRPGLQEFKLNQREDQCVRYQARRVKSVVRDKFIGLMSENLPYCKIRYIF